MPTYRYEIFGSGILRKKLSGVVPSGFSIDSITNQVAVDVVAPTGLKLDLDAGMRDLGFEFLMEI